MAFDMQAAVKIAASVSGGSSIDDLKKSLDGVSNTVNGMTGKFSAVTSSLKGLAAAFGVFKVSEFVMGVVHSVAALDDMAEKTGATVEGLSGLQRVAKITGTDMDTVADAMIKLTKALKGKDEDSKGASEALRYLGIGFKEFMALNPEDRMLRVAQELDKFRDGAGKTAIALDLFGKSGAQMLPFLKDLAEEGALVGKVTAEQAAQAESLEKNIARLSAMFGSYQKQMAIAVIPVLDKFVLGLRDAFNGVSKFEGNDTLVRWASAAAKAVAALIDVFVFIGKAIRAVIGSFQAVFADISLAGDIVMNGPMAIWSDAARTRLKKALDDRNKTVEEANARYSDLWNYNGSATFDAVSKRLDELKMKGGKTDSKPKPAATYNGRVEEVSRLQSQLEMIEKYGITAQGALDKRKEELNAVNMSSIAYKNLSDTQALDLKNQEMSVKLLPEAKKKLDEITEALKKQTVEFNNREYAQKRSAEYGAKSFLKNYLEDIGDMAKATERVMSNAFKSMEDAMVEFTMSGKLNFADMARSIIRDLVRIQIQQSIMKPMGGWLQSNLPGFLGSMFGAKQADGGVWQNGIQKFANGGIVSSPTLFGMAGGTGLMGEAGPEAIMPLKRGPDGKLGVQAAGGTGGTVNNVTVNVSVEGGAADDTRANSGQGAALGAAITRAVQAELLRQKRPGGILAA